MNQSLSAGIVGLQHENICTVPSRAIQCRAAQRKQAEDFQLSTQLPECVVRVEHAFDPFSFKLS